MHSSIAYANGGLQALFALGLEKFADYSPEQLKLMERHWGAMSPEQMLEMNRARALAPQGPAAAQFTQMHNASRARAGLGPNISPPLSGLGWRPGEQHPIDIRSAREKFVERFMEGQRGPAPQPIGEAEWAARRANIPAAKPSTDVPKTVHAPNTLENTIPAGVRAGTATIRTGVPSALAETVAATPRALKRMSIAKTLLRAIR